MNFLLLAWHLETCKIDEVLFNDNGLEYEIIDKFLKMRPRSRDKK
jgi:hypothetical protein